MWEVLLILEMAPKAATELSTTSPYMGFFKTGSGLIAQTDLEIQSILLLWTPSDVIGMTHDV